MAETANRKLTVFTSVIIFFLSFSHSQVLYDLDFEGGITNLLQKADSQSTRLVLVENNNLDQWPLKNGNGILDADVPSRRENFIYRKREGNILKNVSGIVKFHPRGADIRFSDKRSLPFRDDDFNVQTNQVLFGGSSVLSGEKSQGFVGGLIEIPEQDQLFCRFYIRFLKPTLVSKSGSDIREIGYYFFGLKQLCKPTNLDVVRLWVWDIFSQDPKLQVRYWTDQGRVDETTDISVAWNRNYCIEVYGKVGQTQNNGVELYWNNKKVFSKMNENVSHVKGISGIGFFKNCLTGTNIICPVILDQIKITRKFIGALPVPPSNIEIKDAEYISTGNCAPLSQILNAYQLFVHSDNVWMDPLFNSGEQVFINSGRIRLPSGLKSSESYFMRLRFKNNNGNWGPFSWPKPFSGVNTQSLILPLDSIKISHNLNGQNLNQIYQDHWYILSIKPGPVDLFKNVNTVRCWIHSKTNNLGNRSNKGGMFDLKSNLIFSFDLNEKNIFGRDSTNNWASKNILGQRGIYFDDRDDFYVSNLKNNLITVRFKIPPGAEKGFWTVNAFSLDEKDSPSDIIKFSFLVRATKPVGRIKTAIIVSIVILFACFLLFKIKKQPNIPAIPKDREDEIIEKALRQIKENFASINSVQEISRNIGLSHEYFRKIFKKKKNKRINKFLLDYRIEHACDFLKTTNLTIYEVMDKVGIKDISYFTKTFKKATGSTPTQYRQKFRR